MALPHHLLMDETLDGVRSRAWLVPGYRSPANGICADRLYYAVGTPERCCSFTVNTGKYPPEVTWVSKQKPEGWDVSVHVKVEEGGNPNCLCLDGARCHTPFSAGLAAHEQYEEWQKGEAVVVDHEVVLDYLRKMHREGTWAE